MDTAWNGSPRFGISLDRNPFGHSWAPGIEDKPSELSRTK